MNHEDEARPSDAAHTRPAASPDGAPAPGEHRPGTRCVHGGWRADEGRPGVVVPQERSVTFRLSDLAYSLRSAGRSEQARVYSRESSPTLEAVEQKLANLDGAESACLYASGMAALHAALLATVEPGGRVLVAERLYGGSDGLLDAWLPRQGTRAVRFSGEVFDLTAKLTADTRLVLVESLANPTLDVADVSGLAQALAEHPAKLLVDATFATPMAQRPLALGADLVWHSATKYLGGHSDVLAGALCGDRMTLDAARHWRTLVGATPDPEAAWLLDRGMKTLGLRFERASENASELAAWLSAHPEVEVVHHPSLLTGAAAQRAESQLDLPGGVLSFAVRGGDARADRLVRALEVFTEAASLGGVESLASQPVRMSHVGLSAEQLADRGIVPGFIRLAVGVEDAADLRADLERALAASAG
ncbi:MAG: trans-sulfuration enzyme family protein [Planctomycetota bacterium]|jgi:cystathionine beta-lyase/cystathionine gamma-synthase